MMTQAVATRMMAQAARCSGGRFGNEVMLR
jgi:hypothetical protein